MLANDSAQAHPLTGRARLWLVLTSAVILTTLLVGYTLTDSPRSWMTWLVLVFICFVEFTVGMIAAETAGGDSPQQMSSAMAAVVMGSAALFGLVGFATLFITLALTKQTPSRDAVVVSVLVVETVVFLVGMVLLRHTDFSIRASEQASVESHRTWVSQAARIREVVYSLRSLKPANTDHSIQVESLVKGLESCESQLRHSHRNLPEAGDSLESAVRALEAAAAATTRDGLNEISLKKLAKTQEDLKSVTRRLTAD